MEEERLCKPMEKNIQVIGSEGNNTEKERNRSQVILSAKEFGNTEEKFGVEQNYFKLLLFIIDFFLIQRVGSTTFFIFNILKYLTLN